MKRILIAGFNPTLVRLALLTSVVSAATRERFNPTLVRLAQHWRVYYDPSVLGFNPTLVRLAPQRPARSNRRALVSIPPWFD